MLTVGSNDNQLERAVGYNGPNKKGGGGSNNGSERTFPVTFTMDLYLFQD